MEEGNHCGHTLRPGQARPAGSGDDLTRGACDRRNVCRYPSQMRIGQKSKTDRLLGVRRETKFIRCADSDSGEFSGKESHECHVSHPSATYDQLVD